MSLQILEGCSDTEKTAYLTAIASIATADNSASENEINYLIDLAGHAGLSDASKESVIQAALDSSGNQLKASLDILKNSELKYSLITDLIAFAETDSNLAPEEKQQIAAVAQYMGVSAEQLEALNEYVQHTAAHPVEAMGAFGGGGAGNGLLDQLGIGDKLKNSGINMGSLAKGLISFVGPMIIGNLLNKGMNKSSATNNAGLGGLGNLGSLVSGLTGGKGLSGMGGLLSGLLK